MPGMFLNKIQSVAAKGKSRVASVRIRARTKVANQFPAVRNVGSFRGQMNRPKVLSRRIGR